MKEREEGTRAVAETVWGLKRSTTIVLLGQLSGLALGMFVAFWLPLTAHSRNQRCLICFIGDKRCPLACILSVIPTVQDLYRLTKRGPNSPQLSFNVFIHCRKSLTPSSQMLPSPLSNLVEFANGGEMLWMRFISMLPHHFHNFLSRFERTPREQRVRTFISSSSFFCLAISSARFRIIASGG